ncbi:histidine phosphatase family protein [Macrococcus brunensis]|uniref:Histidine phosphatase family protein n=1 Tax=Macrococcus brunensis TaxID=198483 RepID=A0A4R6BBD9_9STAP|nr:histidine phosphatase family protein [Macrococcus brunensis]TDL94299.1 histidine phosphatase family protein [Macrococcus brunensis]
MCIVYFVRHAKRDTSIQTDETAPLTDKGLRDADQLKYFFSDKNIQTIYSSPYKRTIDTIEPTALSLDLSINIIDEFHERKIGAWIDDFPIFAEQQWKDFNYKRQNGESLDEVGERLLDSYQKLEQELNSDVIICGHGTAFAVLFHHLTDGEFGFEEWKQMKMPDLYSYEVGSKELKNLNFSEGVPK